MKQCCKLKPDSLAYALFHAAKLLASVLEGASLTVCYERAVRKNPDWDESVRGAIRDLAWNTLRDYGRGNATLKHFLSRPLPAPIHALLLVAVYRLEQRPEQAHTLVNQAVDASACLAAGLKDLVNAVLRNILRQKAELAVWRDEDIAARYAYPAWWIKRIQRNHGEQWEHILAMGNQHPPMSLRVNCRRATVETYMSDLADLGIETKRLDNDALLMKHPLPISKLPGFAEGKVSVQDAGAQWAAKWMHAQNGERVLDACAAPGGKSAHLLELADIELTALESDPSRAKRMRKNFSRLGISARTIITDCRALDSWWDGRPFDRILADVPCSASGVVRRHPDIKWLRRNSDIAGFVAQQIDIIDTLWHILANGGTMLYVTCSVFDDENGHQIEHFLAHHPDAELFMPRQIHPFLPTTEHDGFYYASLRKKN